MRAAATRFGMVSLLRIVSLVGLVGTGVKGMGIEDRIVAAAAVAAFAPEGPQRLDMLDVQREVVKERFWELLGRGLRVFPLMAGYAVTVPTLKGPVLKAQRLREVLVELGPTFIKMGQGLANRPDLLGYQYCQELTRLEGTIPTYSNEKAMKILYEELGRLPSMIYESLSPEPIAAASIGQVYRGRLRDSAEEVVVKIQRPSVRKDVMLDIVLLRLGASLATSLFGLKSDLLGVVDEFGNRLFNELNYKIEAENCIKFKSLYGENVLVQIPKVFETLTTTKVLTEEFIEGEKLNNIDDPERMIDIAVEFSVTQLLSVGYLHADPLPGNLLRTPDGKLGYIDYGLMTEITRERRYGLLKAVIHMVDGDFDLLARDLSQLGFIEEGVTFDEKEWTGLDKALANAIRGAAGGRGMSKISFTRLTDMLIQVGLEYPLRVPPYWTLVVRTMALLEGVAIQIDFKLIMDAYPYIVREFLYTNEPELRQAMKELLLDESEEDNVYRINWDRLIFLVKTVRRLEGRGESYQEITQTILKFMLGKNGEIFREAFIEDIVDAIEVLGDEFLFSLQTGQNRRQLNPEDRKLESMKKRDRINFIYELLQQSFGTVSLLSAIEAIRTIIPTPQIQSNSEDSDSNPYGDAITRLAREIVSSLVNRRATLLTRNALENLSNLSPFRRS